jgi:hypothetical protein
LSTTAITGGFGYSLTPTYTFAPANTSWIIPRQRRNADRVCRPSSPGLLTFAAYFRLIPTTTTASTARNATRRRAGFVRCRRAASERTETGEGMAALPCGREWCQGGEL